MAKKKSWYDSLQEYNPIDVLSKKINPSPTELTDAQKKRKKEEALMNPAKTTLAPSNSVIRKAAAKVGK